MSPIPAYKCQRCGTPWPSALGLKSCPECHPGVLHFDAGKEPIELDEAKKRKAHAEFHAFYRDEWEPARIARGDLSPEELGRLEALAEIERIRQLEQDWKAA